MKIGEQINIMSKQPNFKQFFDILIFTHLFGQKTAR